MDSEKKRIGSSSIEPAKKIQESRYEKYFLERKKIENKKYLIFKPTKRFEQVFSMVLVFFLLISLFSFPINSLLHTSKENLDKISFRIGWPVAFFELSYAEPDKNPINFLGLIVDLTIYLIVAYIIELLINFTLYNLRMLQGEIKNQKIKSAKNLAAKSKREDSYSKARKFYEYHQKIGTPQEKIKEMLKKNGWLEKDISKVIAYENSKVEGD